MERSVEQDAVAASVECEHCRGCFEFESAGSLPRCPLCDGVLRITEIRQAFAQGKSKADRRVFERVLYAAIARAGVGGHLLARTVLTEAFRPIHVPMRRISGRYFERRARALGSESEGLYQVDICTAVGLPDGLITALEETSRETTFAHQTPLGVLRMLPCDESDGRNRMLNRLQRVLQNTDGSPADILRADPAQEVHYYRKVWLFSRSFDGRKLHLAIDAFTHDVLLETWTQDVVDMRARSPRDWMWLAIPLCVLAIIGGGILETDALPGRIDLVLVVILLGLFLGWFYSQRRRTWARLRKNALKGDLIAFAEERRRLKIGGALSLLTIAFLCFFPLSISLYRLSSQISSKDPIPFLSMEERGIDAENLRPWSSININFLQSPLAVNGKAYVVTDVAPRIGPRLLRPLLIETPFHGVERVVGTGGYASLSEAIKASSSGDRIRVLSGRQWGGHAVVSGDLEIVGEPGATVLWDGGRGPYIEIGGADTTLRIRHLRLDGHYVNSSIIGDPNSAYGQEEVGFRPHLVLEDVVLSNNGGGSINFQSPGSTVEVYGGFITSMTVSNAERVVVKASRERRGVVSGVLFADIMGSKPRLAHVICVICLHDIDEVFLDNVGVRSGEAEVLVDRSIGRFTLGPHLGNIHIRFVDSEGRDHGVLPIPRDSPFTFRVGNGVAEY